jgi:hypothetical protein
MNCISCGNSFNATRSDARYCSGRCRVRAHRRKLPVATKELVTFKHVQSIEELVLLSVKSLMAQRDAQQKERHARMRAAHALMELRTSIELQGINWWAWWEASSLSAFRSRKDVERLLRLR